jgi:hypothetical protein
MSKRQLCYERHLLKILRGKKESAARAAKALLDRDLECVVCLDVPTGCAIYSCVSCSNVMCVECLRELRSCPSCRTVFRRKKTSAAPSYVRNLAVENIVRKLHVE